MPLLIWTSTTLRCLFSLSHTIRPTQTILSLLESLEVSPSPYLLDLGDRSDVRTLTPLFARMMGHGGHLPSLIVNGEVVGDYEAIARLEAPPPPSSPSSPHLASLWMLE